jgi:hypothetical protein
LRIVACDDTLLLVPDECKHTFEIFDQPCAARLLRSGDGLGALSGKRFVS